MKVAIAFGTRPEVIKIAPVYMELKRKGIDTILIATAQHRDMMDMMLKVFNMKPDVDMNIMTHDQTLNYVASKVINEMEKVFKDINVDVLIVQGDTTTAMSSALAAFHNGIKVAHVEAGLRSGNIRDPFPEEMNRRVIDVFADYAFAPTRRSRENLLREGIEPERIFLTGNTVVDSLKYISENVSLDEEKRDYVLVTMHRRENFGDKMRRALEALRDFSRDKNVKVVFPVHKNPRVRKVVYEVFKNFDNVDLIEPVDYVKFLALLKNCKFVMTDSGGVQEEAPSFGKFVVVARETTERPELIESGWGVLAGTSKESVYKSLEKALSFSGKDLKNPFGDGRASERIVNILTGEKFTEFEG